MLREFISRRRESFGDWLDDRLGELGCIVLVAVLVVVSDEIAAQERRQMLRVVQGA